MSPSPLGKDPFSRSPWTPGPLGHSDAASPLTPAWYVGATPGPLGVKDHGDPNPIRLYRPIMLTALLFKVSGVSAGQGPSGAAAEKQPPSDYTVVVTDASLPGFPASGYLPAESYYDGMVREALTQGRYGVAICHWACHLDDIYAVAARKREVPIEGRVLQTIVTMEYKEVQLAWSLVTFYRTGQDWEGKPTTLVDLLLEYGLGKAGGKVGEKSKVLKKLIGNKELREKLGEIVGEKSSEKILELLGEGREFDATEALELAPYRLAVVFRTDKLSVVKPVVPRLTIPPQKEPPVEKEPPPSTSPPEKQTPAKGLKLPPQF